MAKFCINCEKKISYSEKKLELVHEKVYFCDKCAPEARALLNDIKIMSDDSKYADIKARFDEQINNCSYNNMVRDCIRREFSIIALDYMEKDGQLPCLTRIFRAEFKESYNAILKAAEVVFDMCSPLGTVISGETKVASFMASYSSAFSSNSLIAATITLISRGGQSVIQTKSVEDLWGGSVEYLGKFWKTLSANHLDWQFEDVSSPEITLGAGTSGTEPLSEGKTAENRIGVLGGTFDPVHLGHKALAEAAIREANLEKLIIMPARMQPFKMGKRVTEDYHRLAMVQKAFENSPKVEVSDYEIYNTYISYTYDTLVYLAKQYPDKEIWFVMGTDSFLDLDTWYKGTSLLKKFSFIVSVRPGYREKDLEDKIKKYNEEYGAKVIKAESLMPDISSTDIRETYRRGESISSFVPEAVERYIIENGLYE